MPRRFARGSISSTLTWMNLVVSGTALLLAGGALGAYDLISFRADTLDDLSVQARMIASNSVSALVFNDPASAETTISAVSTAPDVITAVIYTADGAEFAAYRRTPEATHLPDLAIPDGLNEVRSVNGWRATVSRRVLFDGRPVGVVQIRADLQSVRDHLIRGAGIAVLVLGLSLVAAMVVSRVAQRGISRPLLELAGVATRVSEDRNYAVRAPTAAAFGELAGLTHAFNDMLTQIERRDRALEEAQRELESRVAQRTRELQASNEELEAFSYSVSHDLRAPLRHVTGFSSLLERHAGAALDERAQRYLRTISESATRMGRLIDDLLAFSRMGRAGLTKRTVPLGPLVSEVVADVTAAVPDRRIAWRVHPLPDVEADPALLRLALENLLSNAVKYTGTRDVAEIEVGTVPGGDDEVVVFVRDNGVGFEMEYAHKLFGVFQRLHRQEEFSGTGIGLANVRRIINRHGGRTWAEGVLDRGATFFFSLPYSESPARTE
ncbi:MAG: ATP-binding protein [Vicinamibacterales bacterium]